MNSTTASPNRRPVLIAVLALCVVAFAGLCVGIALDRALLSRPAFPQAISEPPGLESSPALRKAFLAQLSRELDLSEAQRAAVERLVERERPRIRAAFDSARTIMKHAVEQPQQEMMAILTPEQQTKFRKLLPDF